jgi:uncharacterized protein (TIRG00374 family)
MKRGSLRLTANLAGSVMAFALLAYWVPIGDFAQALLQLHPQALLAAAFATVLNLVLRGLRWAQILGMRRLRAVRSAGYISTIGIGLNALLPAKAGELVRITLTTNRQGVGLGEAVGGAIAERLVDLIVLLLVFWVGVHLLTSASLADPRLEEVISVARSLGLMALLITLALIAIASEWTNRRLRRFVVQTFGKWRMLSKRALRLLTGLRRALILLTRVRRIAFVLGTTLLMWLMSGVGIYFAAFAAPTVELPLSLAIALSAVTVLASALPSAPGGWGVYEAAALVFLSAFYDAAQTPVLAALMVAIHVVQVATVVACGAMTWILLNKEATDPV